MRQPGSLLRRYAASTYDLAPLDDLGRDERPQLLGRHWGRLRADVDQALAQIRAVQGSDGDPIELLDDRLGCATRREQSEPCGTFISGEAGFCGCRHVGQSNRPAL